MLRGKAPDKVEKRLKALFYGPAGVGKTTAAIQFPRPYLIDTERGAENDQYVKLLKDAGGAYFGTADPEELTKEVLALLSEKHEYRTLIIDPLTVIYNDLLDKGIDKAGGTDFGRHKIEPDRKIKHLLSLLLRLDMNVIITSHAKPNWVRAKDAKGKDTAVQEGITFDCYGRLDYLFDLVFEIGKRGKERVGVVKKTRVEGFPEGDIFPFSYEEIATRYGRSILERDATPTALATTDQVAEARRLVEVLSIGADVTDKWFDKAGAASWAEMPADNAAKCIAWMNGRVKGTEVAA